MPRQSRVRRPTHSISMLELRLRWQRSWASWLLRRAKRRRTKEARRTVLLLETLDRQHLLEKELEQQETLLAHRLQELAESREFRRAPSPGLAMQALPPARVELDRLLRARRVPELENPTSESTPQL